jgi:hypothetical protein
MKSGPDVFADALVPLLWLSPARQIIKISQSKLSSSAAASPQDTTATTVASGQARLPLPRPGARRDCREWLSFREMAG